MRRIIALVLFGALLLGCTACGSRQTEDISPGEEISAGLFAMDTYLNLTAYGEGAEGALKQAQERIRELEGLWSVTDEHSEIYAANHSGGTAVTVIEDTAHLVRYALDMAERTAGALEPTLYPVLTAWGFTTDSFQIPEREELDRLLEQVDYTKISLEGAALTVPEGMQLDLGAVGKGCAADETAAVLRENGVDSALLDFGGNILTIGTKPDAAQYWREHQDFEMILLAEDRTVYITEGLSHVFSLAAGQDGREIRLLRLPQQCVRRKK